MVQNHIKTSRNQVGVHMVEQEDCRKGGKHAINIYPLCKSVEYPGGK